MLRMHAGKLPHVMLGTDGRVDKNALTPEHGTGATNADVAQAEDEASEMEEATLEEEMEEVSDPLLDRNTTRRDLWRRWPNLKPIR